MVGENDDQRPPRGRPGPKRTGRRVVIMTISVTPAQKAAIEELAAAEECSASAIMRRLIDDALAATKRVRRHPAPSVSDG